MTGNNVNRFQKPNERPCVSCPFKPNDQGHCFEPQTLRNTIKRNCDTGFVHACHKATGRNCIGQLAFMKRRGELHGMSVYRFALSLGLTKDEDIPDVETFPDWKSLLDWHRVHSRLARLLGNRKGTP